jgi:hypothetical protein
MPLIYMRLNTQLLREWLQLLIISGKFIPLSTKINHSV